MALCRYLILVGIILVLLTGTLGFTARLQTPWDRYPSVSSYKRLPNKASSTRSELVTAKESKAAEDDDKGKQDDAEDDAPKPRIFVASSQGVQDVKPVVNAAHTSENDSSTKATPTVRSSLKSLIQMCRPSNFPGVALFHMLGAYLSLSDTSLLVPTLMKPQMMLTLFVLLGVTSTSMVINDYYDNKSGVDAHKHTSKPLVDGRVPPSVVKAFLNYVYAVLLLSAAAMPGIASRVSVMSALMLTYWYTKHLKPVTWLKNFVCASIMAFAPVASGAAAMQLTTGSASVEQLLSKTSLWRLVGMLFAGFMGREIIMDINDVVDDRLHRIRTVPVKYGRKFGAGVGLFFNVVMSAFALTGPILDKRNRSLALAGVGSGLMLLRAFNVYRTEGEDRDVVDKFINEAKLTVVVLLASFV